jgi:hypothetical protein
VIAKHDFADGDDVPGSFFAMGPGIKHGLRLMGFEASVYDTAPAILHIYRVEPPKQMRGHVLDEILETPENKVAKEWDAFVLRRPFGSQARSQTHRDLH